MDFSHTIWFIYTEYPKFQEPIQSQSNHDNTTVNSMDEEEDEEKQGSQDINFLWLFSSYFFDFQFSLIFDISHYESYLLF